MTWLKSITAIWTSEHTHCYPQEPFKNTRVYWNTITNIRGNTSLYIHLYLKGFIDVLPVAKTMTGIAGHTYSTILPVSVDDVANAHQFIEMWDDEIQLAEESFNVDTEVLNTNITEVLIQLVNGGAA